MFFSLLKTEYNLNEKYEQEWLNCFVFVHYNTCMYLLEIKYTFIVCRPFVIVFNFDFIVVVVVLLHFSLSGWSKQSQSNSATKENQTKSHFGFVLTVVPNKSSSYASHLHS
jgi:hypothetical protein